MRFWIPSRSTLKTLGGCLVSVSADFWSVFCSFVFEGGFVGGFLFFLLSDYVSCPGTAASGSSLFTFVSSLKAGNGEGSSAVSVTK